MTVPGNLSASACFNSRLLFARHAWRASLVLFFLHGYTLLTMYTLRIALHAYSRKTGEDAYFVCETSTHSFLGVADGVGGWQDMGVDPSLFSWSLVNNAHQLAESGKVTHPLDILGEAYDKVVRERTVLAGSSTACIVAINKLTGLLQCANLGDSGFRLLRYAYWARFFCCDRVHGKVGPVYDPYVDMTRARPRQELRGVCVMACPRMKIARVGGAAHVSLQYSRIL